MTDRPVQFFRRIGEAVELAVTDHERRRHRGRELPKPNREPVDAIPFPDMRVPDQQLCHMIERIRTEGLTMEEVASAFDYPPEVIQRDLAAYYPRYNRYVRRMAAAF